MIDKYTEDIAVDGSLIQKELGFVPQYDLKMGWEERSKKCGNGVRFKKLWGHDPEFWRIQVKPPPPQFFEVDLNKLARMKHLTCRTWSLFLTDLV